MGCCIVPYRHTGFTKTVMMQWNRASWWKLIASIRTLRKACVRKDSVYRHMNVHTKPMSTENKWATQEEFVGDMERVVDQCLLQYVVAPIRPALEAYVQTGTVVEPNILDALDEANLLEIM